MSEIELIYLGDERSEGHSSTTNGVNGMSDLVHDIQNGYPEGTWNSMVTSTVAAHWVMSANESLHIEDNMYEAV